MYNDTNTYREYKRYNEKFQEWFFNKYGKKKEIEEENVREYIY